MLLKEAATVAVWALLVSLLTPTTDAQGFQITPDDLLGTFELTRSGSLGTTNPSCLTPEGQQGTCGRAATCPDYQNLLRNVHDTNVLDFFRRLVCRQTPNLVYVCCPLQQPPKGPTAVPQGANRPPLNQPPGILFHRPSQRPNARRPAQGGFEDTTEDDDNDDRREFQNNPIPSSDTPATFQPQIPPTARPHPRLPPTTTTPPPTRFPPPSSTGILISSTVPISQNPTTTTSKRPDPFPTEPSRPVILPAEGECGTTGAGRPGATPWVVSVGVIENGVFQVVCNGALISHLHVIIAAHCLHMSTSQLTHARLGDLRHTDANLDSRIQYSLQHPDYNPASRDNDVALLTLADPVSFNDNIRPVCLPFPYRFDGFQGQQVQVVGWGAAEGLEESTVQVIGLGKCRKAYNSQPLISNNVGLFSRPSPSIPASRSALTFSINPRSSSSVMVDRRHLCGSRAPSASSSNVCLSDHGAPLFYNDQDTTQQHFLVGVSSFGEGCEAGPGLYTRIGAFLPWLVKQLGTVEAVAPSPVPIPVLSPRSHEGEANIRFTKFGRDHPRIS